MAEGLTSEAAKNRLEEHGYNEIVEDKRHKQLDILKRQFASVLILILAIAASLSFITGDMVEFYFIIAIIVIIVATGYFQERKAEKVLQALKKLSEPIVKVVRDGEVKDIESRNVVPGDTLVLEMGDKVPADAKITTSEDLKIDESAITGESNAVKKEEGKKIFSGTIVVHGKGEALVTETGMNTEIGKIASEVQEKEDDTPLQKKIKVLGRRLGIIALVAAFVIFVMGFVQQAPISELFTVTIALAVAAIPEGLPLALTLTLSIGVFGLAKRKATMRRMSSVESLGSTTVICTDKTGTLTKNEMTIERVFTSRKEFKVTGAGYNPDGTIEYKGEEVVLGDYPSLYELLKAGLLCNNSSLIEEEGEHIIRGNPTEGALLTLAHKGGMRHEEMKAEFPRTKENFFTSERKMMSTINKDPDTGDEVSFVKGAPEMILHRCSHIDMEGKKTKMTSSIKREIQARNRKYTGKALRVLALAYKPKPKSPDPKHSEEGLIFLGLVAMEDPPRDGVKETLEQCKKAGIKLKMVTGDNSATAKAIAKKISFSDNPKVITGKELAKMSDKELAKQVSKVDIFARTMPEDKHRLVEAIQKKGEIVAMTGDGINDAPAVKKADVGVGMGMKGTDVTKEASDIVLQDDNFATLVKAISEGRRIFDNIEKMTSYLVSTNFAQIMIIAVGVAILGFEYLPLLALQILFINVIGGELLAISLGMEPEDKGIMDRPPRDTKTGILHKRNLVLGLILGLFMTAVCIAAFIYAGPKEDLNKARTVIFLVNNLMFVAYTFNFKSLEENALGKAFNNKWVVLAAVLTLILLFITIYVPPAAAIFSHTALDTEFWLIGLIASLVTLGMVEVIKKLSNALINTSYMWKRK